MKQICNFCLFLLSLVFFQNAVAAKLNSDIQDPEVYAKKYIAALNTGDSNAFKANLSITAEKCIWLRQQMKNSPMVSVEDKNNLRGDEAINAWVNASALQQSGRYKTLLRELKEKNISCAGLVYEYCFYEMIKSRDEFVTIKMNIQIRVRDEKNNHHLISIEGVYYLNGEWQGGSYQSIQETDQYNNMQSESNDTAEVVVPVSEEYIDAQQAEEVAAKEAQVKELEAYHQQVLQQTGGQQTINVPDDMPVLPAAKEEEKKTYTAKQLKAIKKIEEISKKNNL